MIRTYVSTPAGTIREKKNDWINRLDELPFPARHLFPISKIMEGDNRHVNILSTRGCSSFWIGIESGSQAVLDNMNKQTSVDKNREFLKNCQTLGITTMVNMMVGYPGKTENNLKL